MYQSESIAELSAALAKLSAYQTKLYAGLSQYEAFKTHERVDYSSKGAR